MNDTHEANEWGHVPVLLQEVIDCLQPLPVPSVLDCTLGFGSHSAALTQCGLRVTGIDRDPHALARAQERLGDSVEVLAGTFGDVAARLQADGHRFGGVLADIGVSSVQLDDAARGFSIRSEHPLDMRMTPTGDDIGTARRKRHCR